MYKIIHALALLAWSILCIAGYGLRRLNFKKKENYGYLVCLYGGIWLFITWNYLYLQVLHWLFPGMFSFGVCNFLVAHVAKGVHFFLLSCMITIPPLVALGFKDFVGMRKYQNALNEMGLKTASGMTPKILQIIALDAFKTKLIIGSAGIGIDQYIAKKGDLAASFGAIIDGIRIIESNRKNIEILLTKKELSKKILYSKCESDLSAPASFMVGESLNGIITQSIKSLPHLLIAGTSGNGKSFFFKQTMLSLLKTTPHIQLFLLDLKRGVEVKELSGLPNVQIAKNEIEAVKLLAAVREEMMDRFKFLEGNKFKLIDPERDKRDLIVVGVDEASVLYGKENTTREKKELVMNARLLTDEIAKLGRAAGIHLVLATQKVTTESIDTKVQENIGGRVCFRVNTLAGSNTVLGNKMACELPEVKGRAIWGYGNTFVEVQTPFLPDEELEEEVNLLKIEFEKGKRKNLQSPLGLAVKVKSEKTDDKEIYE